jgi:hypothetical protein
LFVHSWDDYLDIQADQAQQLTLKDFIDTTIKESATAPVALELDQIMDNSHPQLTAFVAEQVTKTTKKL